MEQKLGDDLTVKSISLTADDHFLVCGRKGRRSFVAKYDTDGNEIWMTELSKRHEIYSVTENSNGGIGALLRDFRSNITFLEFDKDGVFLDEQVFKGRGKSRGRLIRATPDGGFIIAGVTQAPRTATSTS